MKEKINSLPDQQLREELIEGYKARGKRTKSSVKNGIAR